MTLSDRKIIDRLISDILAEGYTVSVFDGEEYPLRNSADRAAITGALASSDEDRLFIHSMGSLPANSWVWLIYGNGPGEVISDYTASPGMEALLKGANALADEIAEAAQ